MGRATFSDADAQPGLNSSPKGENFQFCSPRLIRILLRPASKVPLQAELTCSNPVQFVHCELVLDVPGVERGRRLEKQDPAFFIGDRLMLDSARDHDELTLFEMNALIAEFDAKPSLDHEEHLVFVLVVMPDEFAFQLVEFHQLAIEFARDVGFPVFVNLGEFGDQIDLFHDGG
jgi:hypothetical protein